jgi:hypothetical protein
MVISDQSPPISTGSPHLLQVSKLLARQHLRQQQIADPQKGLEMKNFVITPLAAVALGAAALGLAGAATAFPNAGTAADVVDSLKAEGYNVQVNGFVQVPLKLCTATDVHPTLNETDTLQEKQHTQVFVDVSCPSHD